MPKRFEPNFSSPEEFIAYLQTRLIPDLRESGRDCTADDFQEAIHWLSVGGARPKSATPLRKRKAS